MSNNYFRFEIPRNSDGALIAYSPGWFGTIAKCPKNVTVDLYNDKEGYGIAHTSDAVIPKEVKLLDTKEATGLIAKTVVEAGVWKGATLLERIAWLPEADVQDKEVSVEPDTPPEDIKPISQSQKAQFCPICHTFIIYLPDNLITGKIIMTCPNGHKVVVNG